MNAVEIADAIADLFSRPLDPAEFPYAFLWAFGNKETTLRKLRTGGTNKSDVDGVLQRANIHLAVAPAGRVGETLAALRESPATAKHKVKFILATDGDRVEAEELGSGEPLSCDWEHFPEHFGMFLPLAGISTVKEIRENTFDIRATAKLNKLYVSLLKENPGWGVDERRPDLNHFFARLIFCYFAEDTGIFADEGLFTRTVTQMSAPDSSNTHEVLGILFTAMNTAHEDREAAGLPRWASAFPYVNGGLFSGSMDVPRFSRSARGYLLQVGTLDWKQINPDIFGSMIQAVADDEERGALGMHYTSVPNILKVLNPLFLDDLRAKLEEAGDSARKLLNLRHRIARIRVFDPACGSGNFLVIAYKEMRTIEDEINTRRGEVGRTTEIPLTNFRGIELRDFAAEIARLALIIAEFQCDVLYRGQQEALTDFLPLDSENWITCGNALRVNWLDVCPPTETSVKLLGDDLFSAPLDQPEIDFENAGGETYICGNPPYLGSKWQTPTHKATLAAVLQNHSDRWRLLDYVAAWFVKAAEYSGHTPTVAAFVATNSVCQGQQVGVLWPIVRRLGNRIVFAHTSFEWSNLAAHNAGVTVVIVGITSADIHLRKLETLSGDGAVEVRQVANITGYLTPGDEVYVTPRSNPIAGIPPMVRGNSPTDGGHLILERNAVQGLIDEDERVSQFVRPFVGSKELVGGFPRFCFWVPDEAAEIALTIVPLRQRIEQVREFRLASKKQATVRAAAWPHRFDERKPLPQTPVIGVPVVSSERRPYLPITLLPAGTVVSNKAFMLPAHELWPLALLCSRTMLVWVATVCARMRTDFSFTNTLGWNTYPLPTLTEQNKADLTRSAEEILLAREVHYPATIAELYDPKRMPANLREAHERNDQVLERIYIGRRFRNDTERLEKLFEMYTRMTGGKQRPARGRRARG